jgi:predicted permease
MSMSLQTNLDSVYATFLASVRSVGTACTLAVVGIYLHRQDFVVGDGKRTLALISQQVTIPLFLFTKIVFCNQDWSDNPCPDIIQSLQDVWLLFFWPAYVVAAGIAVGYVVAHVTKTPPHQVRAVLACCAFGNSTGLPMTLLTVVHANFPATSDLGRIDPTLFLSVYLLLYPVLQWGVGGWLLAPPDGGDEKAEDGDGTKSPQKQTQLEIPLATTSMDYDPKSSSYRLAHNVLNNVATEHLYNRSRRGLSETDASLYMSVQEDLNMWDPATNNVEPSPPLPPPSVRLLQQQQQQAQASSVEDEQPYATQTIIPLAGLFTSPSDPSDIPKNESSALLMPPPAKRQVSDASMSIATSVVAYQQGTLWDTLQKIGSRCLQPPVVGAICGMMVAATPLRGIFVDLIDRQSHAPLQWLFDGLYQIGGAAVPINMMILGCNLSASYTQQQKAKYDVDAQSKLLDSSTMMGVVIGKMLILPMVGFLSTYILRTSQIIDVPDDIDGAFYLVLMIVFLTPTANNVMVMVELSGSGTKEGIAQSIAWQYMSAPFMLSLTMSMAVGMADHWGA